MPHLTETSLQLNKDTSAMFKEFFIIAAELACLYKQGVSVPMSTSCSIHCDGKDTGKAGSKRMSYEVFLGGSCNPTTWRADIAIPTLQSLGITYYNPQVSHWAPELIAQEYEAKETARILLFVIDDRTRNCAGIIEAAALAATRRDSLIVVINPYRQGQTILGETMSNQEYYELMNGLLVLQYLMERQRIPIFESISAALNCTSKILRNNKATVQDLYNEDGIRPSRISLAQNATDVTKLRETFKSLDANDTGTISLAEALMILQSNGKCSIPINELRNVINKADTYEKSLIEKLSSGNNIDSRESSLPQQQQQQQRINFDQFCAIASEWSWRIKNTNGINCENWTNSIISDSDKRDLYIGVVGKDILWLESTAVPLVGSLGLTHYRPSTSEYNARVLPLELQRMKNSRLVMLVIPQHARGISIMALAAHLIGLRAKLVLCIQMLPDAFSVSGEKLTEQATRDYNRGRMYLSDMATREGVPVYEKIADALQRAIQIVQSPC